MEQPKEEEEAPASAIDDDDDEKEEIPIQDQVAAYFSMDLRHPERVHPRTIRVWDEDKQEPGEELLLEEALARCHSLWDSETGQIKKLGE